MSVRTCLAEVMMGLVGTHIVSDTNLVWLTKTHFPLNVYRIEEEFNAQKMIVIMRNPIDVIPSLANLFIAKSHDFVFENKIHEEFPKFWDEFVDAFIKNIEIS